MRRASWMSFGIIVTRWIAHRLVSSKSPTRWASLASSKAPIAALWKRRSVLSPEQFPAADAGRDVCESEVQWTPDNV